MSWSCPRLLASGPPLRLRNMKDTTGENEHNRRERPDEDETLAQLMSSYTLRQRETLLKGFRILAKVAVRAHIERQAPPRTRTDGYAFNPHNHQPGRGCPV